MDPDSQDDFIACANCGRTIGPLETPYVYEENTVCGECADRLNAELGRSTVIVQQSDLVDMTRARPARSCPVCGSSRSPVAKSKGSTVVLLVLLFLAIVPGIIYAIFFSGYVYVCPKCGFKYGDLG
jgi:hypothetical protein